MMYLTPIPKQFLDESGIPYSGGTVTVYISGTTDKADIYMDAHGEQLHENPAVLNSNGMWQCFVPGDTPLDYVVKDCKGNVVDAYERVIPASGGIPILATLRLLQKDVDNSGHSTEIGRYFPNGADQDIEIPNELCVFMAFQSWFAYILNALIKGKPSFVIEYKEWYESGERKTEIYIYQAKKFHQENDAVFSSDNYIEFVRIDDDLKKTTLICRGDDDEGQGHWEKKEEYVGVVFYAEYGETLFDDIKAAYDAGKCVMLKQTILAGELIYNLHEYNHSDAMPQFDNFVFECIEAGTYIRKAVCFVNGSWSSDVYHLVTH